MDFVGLLLSVQLVTGPAGADVKVTPITFYEADECERAAVRHAELPRLEEFTKDGRLVMSEEFRCAIVEKQELVDMVAKMDGKSASNAMLELPLEERVDRPAN